MYTHHLDIVMGVRVRVLFFIILTTCSQKCTHNKGVYNTCVCVCTYDDVVDVWEKYIMSTLNVQKSHISMRF